MQNKQLTGETCYAYVRQRGRSWREAPTEVVFIPYSGALDRETVTEEPETFTLRPRATLTIDGRRYCRFRLEDGRIAAVLEHMVRGKALP